MTHVSQFAMGEDGKPLAGRPLLDFVRSLAGDTIFLQFSMGKDSICSWITLREYGQFNIIPYWMYWFPGLAWQEEALAYYEEWFGCHIKRLPHPMLFNYLGNFVYQTPDRISTLWAMRDRFWGWDFADIENVLANDIGLLVGGFANFQSGPYTAVGFRGPDNIDRRNLIIQKGAVGSGRRRYFFPIWEWNLEDITRCIKRHGVKLPLDYKYWGRTIGAWDYQYIKPISEHLPDDFEQMKFWMPLIDRELYRHDVVNRYAEEQRHG